MCTECRLRKLPKDQGAVTIPESGLFTVIIVGRSGPYPQPSGYSGNPTFLTIDLPGRWSIGAVPEFD